MVNICLRKFLILPITVHNSTFKNTPYTRSIQYNLYGFGVHLKLTFIWNCHVLHHDTPSLIPLVVWPQKPCPRPFYTLISRREINTDIIKSLFTLQQYVDIVRLTIKSPPAPICKCHNSSPYLKQILRRLQVII